MLFLKAWNKLDPVSQKEHARNDSIYKIQHNRNPFIDNPQWVDSVWTDISGIIENRENLISLAVYPNPAHDKVYIKYNQNLKQKVEIYFYSVDGQMLENKSYSNDNGTVCINVDGFPKGFYLIKCVTSNISVYKKIILQ